MKIIPTVPYTQLHLSARQLVWEHQRGEAWEKNTVLNIGELRRDVIYCYIYYYFSLSFMDL